MYQRGAAKQEMAGRQVWDLWGRGSVTDAQSEPDWPFWPPTEDDT